MADLFDAYLPALRTITASRWTVFLASVFGRRRQFRDGTAWVEVAEWRGKTYLINASE